MKTLNVIQTLFKIAKVFSKVIYICCIVGFVGCVVGIIAMLVGAQTIKVGGVTLHSILETQAGIGEGTIWSAIVVGMVLCIGEFFVCRKAYSYFDNELKAGTPFTFDGAKELLRLGISVIWIPLVSVIVAEIGQNIIAECIQNTQKLNLDGFNSVALGVMFIVTSLLCKHGAEIQNKKE